MLATGSRSLSLLDDLEALEVCRPVVEGGLPDSDILEGRYLRLGVSRGEGDGSEGCGVLVIQAEQ